MTRLIQAELLKLRTTRAFWLYAASALAFVPASVALAITAGPDISPLGSSAGVRNVLSAASAGGLLVLLVGISMTAGEFRHNTATATFLITPDRARVLLAKFAVGAGVGAVVAVLSSLLTLAVALPWLDAKGVDVRLFSADVGSPLLGAVIATPLAAVVGVGLGAVLRNQTVAVTLMIVWTVLVEALLVGFLPEVGRWLPGGAVSALAGTATAEGGLLPFWGAAAMLAGYAATLAAAGTRSLVRKEVT
jgi:ABC-2 type transport system permease protein